MTQHKRDPAAIPQIQSEACIGCGQCVEACPFQAITLEGPANWFVAKTYQIQHVFCKVCGACVEVCPMGGIEMPSTNGAEQTRKTG